MADPKPWEMYGAQPGVPAGLPAGAVMVAPADPSYQYKGPQAAVDLDAARARAAEAAAKTPYAPRLAAAEVTKAEAEASTAQQKADQVKAESSLASMSPNSQIHGDAYLRKYVPPQMWETVKAYARGDLGSRAGGMSTSMLPIIQHAMNYDPSVSATTFPARAKMQQDLAGSQPNTAGGALRAMERMLLHGQEVLRGGAALNNYGPGVLGSIGNTFRTLYERKTDDPDIAHYDGLVRNYAPEAQKAIAQAPGGQAERQERAEGYSASMSQASRAAALQADARQAMDAMGAVNEQYKRLMGRDITDALSPEAKKAYDTIMAGGYDGQGRALHPADGYQPGSVSPSNGGGSPPSNGGGPSGIATGGFRNVSDPTASAVIDRLVRQGKSASDINAALAPLGYNQDQYVNQGDVDAAQRYLKAHPNYKGSLGSAQKQVPTTAFNRIAASPIGALAINAGDAVSGGLVGALSGRRDAIDAVSAANPGMAFAGNLVGGGIGAAATEMGAAGALARLGVNGARAATWAPRIGDTVYGGFNGATGNPDDPLTGALGGATIGLGGGMFGRAAGRAAGRALRGVVDPNVQYLRAAGVPLTAGQAVGGVGKQLEDAATSIPGVGPVVNNRRLEGMQAFNQAAFDQGLAPINATTNGVTREAGIDAARTARSQAYSAALDPVNLVPDPQFRADQFAADTRGQLLPEDMATRAQFAIDRADENIDPVTGLTGRGLQQSIRRFRRTASENAHLPNGSDLGDVMRDVEEAYTGLIGRQSPQTLPALNAANAANRNVEVLRSAVNAARNGTRVGEAGTFAPSQLADAAAASARRFGNTAGTTNQPFFALSRAGQAVLPSKIADSGTATRAAMIAGAGLLGGGGGYVAGDKEGAAEGVGGTLALGALLAAGGSRSAQRALVSALLDRPNSLVRIGDQIYNRAAIPGMFGAGGAAMLAGR